MRDCAVVLECVWSRMVEVEVLTSSIPAAFRFQPALEAMKRLCRRRPGGLPVVFLGLLTKVVVCKYGASSVNTGQLFERLEGKKGASRSERHL